jgi:hypothetical protein
VSESQLRALLVQAACRTESDTLCADCPHQELRHSPVEPARMSCELFRMWLGETGQRAPFVRLRLCVEAEERARGEGSAPQPKPAEEGDEGE